MTKTFRQAQILDLVRDKAIFTQEELAQELAALGITTTQVTLSRDIREMGLAKTNSGYKELTSVERSKPDLSLFVADYLTKATSAQNLLILNTTPGNASSLAVAIDQQGWPSVVGTIAGDDTVLVIAPDGTSAEELKQRFLAYLR
jgi:transcriptional regulator of arginine metabolism